MTFFKWLTSSMTGLMLVSCVTINIYFPAAAAEKAADKIIEGVWGEDLRKDAGEASEPDAEQQSSADVSASQNLAINILNWMVAPASAGGVNINISSAAINATQAKMKARHGSLKTHYTSGAIGLTENGLVAVRDAKAIALKDRNKVKSLVSAENKDRNALYAEIARANGHPEWKADIQSTFARRWVSKAAGGWWYQSAGAWKKK